MNICNENGLYIPNAVCDCEEVMAALITYKKVVQDLIDQLQEEIDKKQNVLTAGRNITIEEDVISSYGQGGGGGTEYEAGDNIFISGNKINVVDVVTDDEFNESGVLQAVNGTRTTLTITDSSNVAHTYDIIVLG